MLLCSCNACCLYHQIKQTEFRRLLFFYCHFPVCGLTMMYRTCAVKSPWHKAWWMGSTGNGSVHCLGPGFFNSAPSLHSGALASVHRAEHLSSPQPLWWWPALPVRHTEFTSREMKQQGQSFLVTKSLQWMGTWLRKQSSQILIIIPALLNTDLLGMFPLPAVHVFQGMLLHLLKSSWRAGLGSVSLCTFHLLRNLVSQSWFEGDEWLLPLVHTTNTPQEGQSNNQLPKTEAFPSGSFLILQNCTERPLFIAFTFLTAPFHWCWGLRIRLKE